MAKLGRLGIDVGLLYRRVSDDESGDEGLSLATQQHRLRAYCAQHGWRIAGEYEDVKTGQTDQRAGYQALLTAMRRLLREGYTVHVVVIRVDRFSREKLSQQALAFEEITGAGADLHAIDQGGEQRTLSFGMQATIGRHEVEQLGEKVRNCFERLRQQGWWVPNTATWGYTTRPRTDAQKAAGAPKAVLALADAEAPHVAAAFERAARGATVSAVLRWAQTLPDEARGGRKLSRTSMGEILRNPIYAGLMPDGQPGKWPAIVDRETFEQVQAQLAKRREEPKAPASGAYLLTHLLWCPRCGGRMSGTLGTKKGARLYRRYGCNAGRSRPGTCSLTAGAELLERLVTRQVEPIIEASIEALRAWADAALGPAPANDSASRDAERRRLERVRAEAQQKIIALTNDFNDKKVSEISYHVTVADWEAKYKQAHDALADLATQAPAEAQPDIEAVLAKLGDWRARWHQGDVPARRAILEDLITRIVPRRTDLGWAVDITWTGTGELITQSLTQQPVPHQPEQAQP